MGIGLLDPASSMGLPNKPTDFGKTLLVWGAPEGAYTELPLLGPATQRDALGRLVDGALTPTIYLTGSVIGSPAGEIILAMRSAEILALRAEQTDQIDAILYESADSYTELKTSYVQFRRRELGETSAEDDALPDIFEEPAPPPADPASPVPPAN
jgi:phospholipid-binding lipoprotein MlaA